MSKIGIIYILTNESMPNLIKIGKTEKPISERLSSLNNTSVPYDFEVFAAYRVNDVDAIERSFHEAFADSRVNPKREFFKLDAAKAYALLKHLGEDVTPRNQEPTPGLVSPIDDQPEGKIRKGRTDFNAFGISSGTKLTFVRDSSIECLVLQDGQVEFNGETTSLSAAAMKVMTSLGYNWPTIAGTKFWIYNGKSISQLISEKIASID